MDDKNTYNKSDELFSTKHAQLYRWSTRAVHNNNNVYTAYY